MSRRVKKQRVTPSPVPMAESDALKPKLDRRAQMLHAREDVRRIYTRAEVEAQQSLVEQALIQGLSEREILKALAKNEIFIGLNRVRMLKARVHEQMKLEAERTSPMTRSKQLRRLYSQLAEARGKVDPKTGAYITKPVWSAVTRIENLIANIEGNFEPIKIDVDVVHREALTNVLTSITPDQAAQMVSAYDRLATLAEAAAHARGEKLPALLPAPEKRESTVFTQGASSAAE